MRCPVALRRGCRLRQCFPSYRTMTDDLRGILGRSLGWIGCIVWLSVGVSGNEIRWSVACTLHVATKECDWLSPRQIVREMSRVHLWWAGWDSNPRPSPCEGDVRSVRSVAYQARLPAPVSPNPALVTGEASCISYLR